MESLENKIIKLIDEGYTSYLDLPNKIKIHLCSLVISEDTYDCGYLLDDKVKHAIIQLLTDDSWDNALLLGKKIIESLSRHNQDYLEDRFSDIYDQRQIDIKKEQGARRFQDPENGEIYWLKP